MTAPREKKQHLRSYNRAEDNGHGGQSAPVETTCRQCGEQVTRQFVRVFAECDAEGVFGCPACYGMSAIGQGAARPDHDGMEKGL